MSREVAEAFLLRARAQTWASGTEPMEGERPGEKQYTYSEGDIAYHDTYLADGDSFFGQETLLEAGEPVWNIIYAGRVHRAGVKGPGVKAIYAFLQQAVRATITDNRLGRQADFSDGEWDYSDRGKTRDNEFWGSESVSFRGKEVYRLKYGGGWIVT